MSKAKVVWRKTRPNSGQAIVGYWWGTLCAGMKTWVPCGEWHCIEISYDCLTDRNFIRPDRQYVTRYDDPEKWVYLYELADLVSDIEEEPDVKS